MQIIQIILIVITLLGLVCGHWVGPMLAKVLNPIINSPWGAVITTIALLVLIINLINWLICLGRINKNGRY